jgi:single-strand DNA-binding protein
MAGVNKVILIGNLGSDPEVRHLSNGSVVANFNIATSESFTNRNGEKVTNTEWHRIELWDGLARTAEQFLRKGNSVYIEGKLKTESWQDSDGNARTTTRIRGLSMMMLGSKGGAEMPESHSASEPQALPPSPRTPSQEGPSPDGGDTDDLPF